MDFFEEIVWTFDRGCAVFDYPVEASQRLGKRFGEYSRLLEMEQLPQSDTVPSGCAA